MTMPAISKPSFDSSVRYQVLLERLKSGEEKKIVPFLKRIDRNIRLRLSTEALTDFARARLETLLAEVGLMVESILKGYQQALTGDLGDLAVAASRFEANALTSAVRNPLFEAVAPSSGMVITAAMARPLSVRGASGGQLLESFLNRFTEAQKEAVTGAIRQGVFEGQTNQQIIQRIRGTRANRYNDGILATTQRQASAVVRTSVQHVANTARMRTWEENADLVKAYEWVSTLDSRTSEICQALDGRQFKMDEGPIPPAHVNCRSTTVPVLDERFKFLKEGATRASKDGPVDASETYYSWLKKQPVDFQNAAIGPTRAKLLRDGGLSAERFARMRLSRNFQPLTLAEMQRLEPLAFQRAGIKLNPDTGLPVG